MLKGHTQFCDLAPSGKTLVVWEAWEEETRRGPTHESINPQAHDPRPACNPPWQSTGTQTSYCAPRGKSHHRLKAAQDRPPRAVAPHAPDDPPTSRPAR